MPRAFDLAVSISGLLALSPLLLVAGLMIKLASPGPALYRQERIGREGRLFRIYKFRTMSARADQTGAYITGAEDSRIFPLGYWLRKCKVDELPQLINVLEGDMSLVGPRPEVPKYIEHYTEEQRTLLMVRPGITDPASLTFKDEASLLKGPDFEEVYIKEVLPKKLRMSLAYQQRRSFWTDLGIIFRTILDLGN
ncbi:MAG: sugar transferase [Dehalococcoidia bacterium]